ncbi:MAG: hypothetical protein GF341_03045 [candidate division Zixibacteria bacterium]|nr:hypothetical protein [candidate division Zixibacteria bacterium]
MAPSIGRVAEDREGNVGVQEIAFIIIVVIDIWALSHCWSRSLTTGTKILWTILILVFPLFGPLLYVLLGRAK